ncbi:hypothetical protein JOD63_002627 [Microbacterium terrae]|uniref:Uncharacterized protein n=1 Tax=Microbacterium terrae TaxID=69369 RepID=A0A0M2HGQ5_9MICO|nr:hypothetical protein [Microbacterium terrae]KJL43932.1 hypothetical protein RS81_00725 [Microbacterium terrae]MBP1078659.1 hypothetical protein [Microbacterium terrae]GLJ98060.1 hypothetical protein GCM10017594_12570 [Microbacterium terrae]
MSSIRVSHRRAVVVAAVGTVLVCAYAALALTQIFWLNPLAAVPGASLEQIHADMAAAGENLSPGVAVTVVAIGPLLAIGVLVAAIFVSTSTPRAIGVAYLLLLMLGAPGYFAASFGAGMGLADTYGISGADYSPWAIPLYFTSALAFVGLIGIGLASAVQGASGRRVSPA